MSQILPCFPAPHCSAWRFIIHDTALPAFLHKSSDCTRPFVCHPMLFLPMHHREAWHRPPIEEFVANMRRLRWGEIPYGSLRTWGMLGANFW